MQEEILMPYTSFEKGIPNAERWWLDLKALEEYLFGFHKSQIEPLIEKYISVSIERTHENWKCVEFCFLYVLFTYFV